MAYESLYRRYRPQRFSEVRGQAHVVAALHNAVRENRVGHAYLLSGPRGTGKTSTARILAKALNCTNLDDGEPCGVCDSCKAIEAGTSYDLLELDAASNNGVDAMRDLIAKAALGSPGRTKVYLLDEVHMLSVGASNALLKTLEEPPGHVVFVLATTDPHKVLPTIRSRTQHFELHLLSADELRALVDDVIADAGLDLGPDAIEYALRAGGGSARDTLSALDQVVAAGGVLDQGDQVDALVDALTARDAGAALREVAHAVTRGHDPRVVGEALLARIRDVFLLRMGDPLEQATEAERAHATTWAEALSDRDCTRALEAIGDALRDMRTAPDTRIPLEVALVRLTRVDDTSLEALVARVERLERGGGSGAAMVDSAPAARDAGTDGPGPGPSAASTPPLPPRGAGGGRPADAARAALGGRSNAPTPPSASPEPPEPRNAPPPVPPGEQTAPAPAGATNRSEDRAPTPPRLPSDTHAPGERPDSRMDDAVPTGPPAVQDDTDADAVTADPAPEPPAIPSDAMGPTVDINAIWSERVLPGLSGLTKAMFSVGHFVDPSEANGPRARFAVPNDVHREKSLQKLPEVEAALQAALGRALHIELVVEGEHSGPATTSGAATPHEQSAPSRAEVAERQREETRREVDEIGPVDQLDDAPADDRTGTQRLLDAFPGAEIVE